MVAGEPSRRVGVVLQGELEAWRPAPGGADLANLVLMRKFVIRMMKVRENISLLGMNSFGFDVSARRLVEFASAED